MIYTYKTYPTARIQLDAGMYSRQQLQDAICCIDALNAQAKASMQPKKEWVGLTDDEIEHLRNDQPWWMVRDIEAKLKEKNT